VSTELERASFSPFDAGRIPCAQGGEDRWSARWLMEQLGYETWQKFETAIERAKTSAHNEGFNVRVLFRITAKAGAAQVFTGADKNPGGRPGTDYLVTRYAAYLIAMNGDTRKHQVSDAQHYFAVKTREAELAPIAPPPPPAIMPTHSEALRGWAAEIDARELAEAKVAVLEPKAEFYDDLMDADGTYSFLATSKILGWGRNVMMRELRRSGVLQGNNLPYQRYEHHFKVTPVTFTNAKTGELVPTATTTVRPSGLEFLRKKLANSMAEARA
jgi:DNA-damage-inducible protein D